MQFWNVLKYVLVVMLIGIVGVAALMQPDEPATTKPAVSPAVQPQQGPRFNF